MNDKSHLLRFGYAPGNYWFVCRDCGNKHAAGDKRATRCYACAETLYSQVSSVEAVADKHRAMTNLPEEAVKAAYGAYVTFIEEGGAVPVIDAVRAAITAAAPHLAAVRVKAEPWGWIIPRGGSKKPVILEASKFDQASAAAEADIHDLGYFPVYIHSAPVSSEDIDPSRTEGFRQGIDAAAKLADYFEETIYSEGMSEEVYYGISCTVSQIAREIRSLSSPDHADAGNSATHPSGGDRHGE